MQARSALAGLAAAALLLVVTACGSSDDSADAPTDPPSSSSTPSEATPSDPGSSSTPSEDTEPVEMTIEDFAYEVPDSVAPGARITVTNDDDAAHTVTDKSGDGDAFDVVVKGGDTATFTAPSEPGSYEIFCRYHANMSGTLVVR